MRLLAEDRQQAIISSKGDRAYHFSSQAEWGSVSRMCSGAISSAYLLSPWCGYLRQTLKVYVSAMITGKWEKASFDGTVLTYICPDVEADGD